MEITRRVLRNVQPPISAPKIIRQPYQMPNIPEQRGEEVPMDSRLTDGSSNAKENWPHTARYTTIMNNIIGEAVNVDVGRAIEMGLQEKNRINCGCAPGEDCATNPFCKCKKVAEEMAQFYKSEQMKSGEPVDVTLDDFFHKLMFSCSSNCSCGGSCSQNALQEIDSRHQEKFSITRTNDKGFCLFTEEPIKKGFPVLSFNGQLTGYLGLKGRQDDLQYSHELFMEHEMNEFVTTRKYVDTEYRQILRKAYKFKIWINPLKKGNCARFLSHACNPNLIAGRVFQGGLSPTDLRIVFFAKEDIAAKTELTFNYGEKYVQEHFAQCLCEAHDLVTDADLPIEAIPLEIVPVQSPPRIPQEIEAKEESEEEIEQMEIDHFEVDVEQSLQIDLLAALQSDDEVPQNEAPVVVRCRGRPRKMIRPWLGREQAIARRAKTALANRNRVIDEPTKALTRSKVDTPLPSIREQLYVPVQDPSVKRPRGRPPKNSQVMNNTQPSSG